MTEPASEDQLLSTTAIARWLRVSTVSVRRWVRIGLLVPVNTSNAPTRGHLFSLKQVQQALARWDEEVKKID